MNGHSLDSIDDPSEEFFEPPSFDEEKERRAGFFEDHENPSQEIMLINYLKSQGSEGGITSTEANIQQAGLATRIAEKVDQTEDWLRELGWFAAEILLQEIPPQKAIEIAGPNAFWPMLNKQQLYDSVFIDIAAGSTGLPDTNEERMRWIELMPIIMQNIELVQQMRSFGVPEIGRAHV